MCDLRGRGVRNPSTLPLNRPWTLFASRIMSAGTYPNIFSRQVEAVVYTTSRDFMTEILRYFMLKPTNSVLYI